MNKLIRNILVMVAMATVTFTQAQIFSLEEDTNSIDGDYEISIFEESMPGGGNPVDIDENDPEDPDPSPINDYAPLLVLGGIAVYAFSRKKFQLK